MEKLSAQPERSLTVACWDGLANRLRVLISGIALTEASQRRFTMLWPRSRGCAASFSDLFVNDWPVQEASVAAVKDLPFYLGYYCPPLPDVLTTVESHMALLTPHWLLMPARSIQHAALIPKCREFLDALQPAPALAQQVAEFRAMHFKAQMIGVHLRRGDFIFYGLNAADNIASSFRTVDKLLRRWPDAGILLCSDDGAEDPFRPRSIHRGVHQAYRQRYGERVVWRTPRSLDRSRVEATQDALVDLWLLRSAGAFVGTIDSSFSEIAAYGRPVPTVWAEPDDWRYRTIAAALTVTGVARLMRRDGIRRFGRDLSLPRLLHYYRGRLRGRSLCNDTHAWQMHELPQEE